MDFACTRASGAVFDPMVAIDDVAVELECRLDELQNDYGGGHYDVALQRLRHALDDEYLRDVQTSMEMSEVVQGTMCFDDAQSVPVVEPRARGRCTRSAAWASDARMALRFIAIDQAYTDERPCCSQNAGGLCRLRQPRLASRDQACGVPESGGACCGAAQNADCCSALAAS